MTSHIYLSTVYAEGRFYVTVQPNGNGFIERILDDIDYFKYNLNRGMKNYNCVRRNIMGKKLKTVFKIFCVAMLCTFMLSSEALAATKMAAYESMSHFRCNNSSCGAYLWEQPGLSLACTSCGLFTQAYRCKACNRNYDICPNGHYSEIY